MSDYEKLKTLQKKNAENNKKQTRLGAATPKPYILLKDEEKRKLGPKVSGRA